MLPSQARQSRRLLQWAAYSGRITSAVSVRDLGRVRKVCGERLNANSVRDCAARLALRGPPRRRTRRPPPGPDWGEGGLGAGAGRGGGFIRRAENSSTYKPHSPRHSPQCPAFFPGCPWARFDGGQSAVMARRCGRAYGPNTIPGMRRACSARLTALIAVAKVEEARCWGWYYRGLSSVIVQPFPSGPFDFGSLSSAVALSARTA